MKSDSSQPQAWGWQLAATLYATTFLGLLLLAYTGHLPQHLSQIPYYDKIGHVVLYCLATYLGHKVLGLRRINLVIGSVPLFPLLFGIFTIVEEGFQALSPYRTLDAIDLIASLVGVWLGYWFAEKTDRRLRSLKGH
jgi:VanZ family protein